MESIFTVFCHIITRVLILGIYHHQYSPMRCTNHLRLFTVPGSRLACGRGSKSWRRSASMAVCCVLLRGRASNAYMDGHDAIHDCNGKDGVGMFVKNV